MNMNVGSKSYGLPELEKKEFTLAERFYNGVIASFYTPHC
jgi:hypothetical protein